jgi:hypothetical protein
VVECIGFTQDQIHYIQHEAEHIKEQGGHKITNNNNINACD